MEDWFIIIFLRILIEQLLNWDDLDDRLYTVSTWLIFCASPQIVVYSYLRFIPDI